MTTIADVKRAMVPLLERHDDLALVGRFLIIKPVRHILRSICIDRRSSSNIFVPSTSANLSFFKFTNWSLAWGRTLYIHQRLWDIRDEGSIELLRDMIEREALPELRQVNSIDAFLTYIRSYIHDRDYDHNHDVWTIIAIAKGNFGEAISKVDAALADGRLSKEPEFYQALVARDRTSLIKFLHDSEASTIKNLKLGKYWEPTPFPLEL